MDPSQEVYNFSAIELINKESRYKLDKEQLNKIFTPSNSSKLKTIKTNEINRKRKYYQLDSFKDLAFESYYEDFSLPCKKFKYLSLSENNSNNNSDGHYMNIDS
jgi:hypothetical protein